MRFFKIFSMDGDMEYYDLFACRDSQQIPTHKEVIERKGTGYFFGDFSIEEISRDEFLCLHNLLLADLTSVDDYDNDDLAEFSPYEGKGSYTWDWWGDDSDG